jgi:pyridinium-3,5-biscarboxylic acid mononucleotide sulfurtransferase
MSELDAALAQKRDRLLAILRSCGRVAVAFSGGVDSAVVAKAAQVACGDNAVAVTAVSASLASGEREAAEQLARQIGIRHRVIETQEFENPDYLKNAPDRCYFCKTELYTRLERLLVPVGESLGIDTGLEFDVLVNGANLDDKGDYRPGMKAAREHAVRSPLIEADFTKADVRQLAAHWDLPVWDKPATPCLSSRIAYGLSVTPERVRRVDEAETYLRQEFGLREFRVRHEAGDLARIEVPLSELERLIAPAARQAITQRLGQLGFKFVTLDLDGFRSGSMNAVVPIESLIGLKRPAAR